MGGPTQRRNPSSPSKSGTATYARGYEGTAPQEKTQGGITLGRHCRLVKLRWCGEGVGQPYPPVPSSTSPIPPPPPTLSPHAHPPPASTLLPRPISPTPQAEGAGLAPACDLSPFVHFGQFFTQAIGLHSARALPDTTCSPLSTLPAPPNRRRRTLPGHAWQIRFVSLCRLVQRRSNPSCAASLQARAPRKKRDGQFNATQTLRRPAEAGGAGLCPAYSRPSSHTVAKSVCVWPSSGGTTSPFT